LSAAFKPCVKFTAAGEAMVRYAASTIVENEFGTAIGGYRQYCPQT